MRRLLLPLLLVMVCPFVTAAQDAAPPPDPRLFAGIDLFKIQAASDPQISPDGTQIAYVRLFNDIMTDTTVPHIWLVDVKSGAQRPIASGKGAQISPRVVAGRQAPRLCGERRGGHKPQLNIAWLDSGISAVMTSLSESPNSLTWSPDGKTIAYVMRVPTEPEKLGKAPDKPEGANWAEPLEVIDRVTYRNDDGGYVKAGFSHIFLISADGGGARQLTTGTSTMAVR